MIPLPSGARVWLATGHTDMRAARQLFVEQRQGRKQRERPLSGSSTCASADVERPSLGRDGRGPIPEEVARKGDVLPADRGRVGEEVIRRALAHGTQVGYSIGR